MKRVTRPSLRNRRQTARPVRRLREKKMPCGTPLTTAASGTRSARGAAIIDTITTAVSISVMPTSGPLRTRLTSALAISSDETPVPGLVPIAKAITARQRHREAKRASVGGEPREGVGLFEFRFEGRRARSGNVHHTTRVVLAIPRRCIDRQRLVDRHPAFDLLLH